MAGEMDQGVVVFGQRSFDLAHVLSQVETDFGDDLAVKAGYIRSDHTTVSPRRPNRMSTPPAAATEGSQNATRTRRAMSVG